MLTSPIPRSLIHFLIAFLLLYTGFSLPDAAPAASLPFLSAGGINTCGLRSDGAIACWGDNSYAQSNPPIGAYTHLDLGFNHACAVNTTGNILCWGYNSQGSIYPPSGVFAQISAGKDHSCGILEDRSVACWGDNLFGQSPGALAGAYVQISAGAWHTCAIDANGGISCWGSDGKGQATPPSGTFNQVSAGMFHNCAIRTDGSLVCWGDNTLEQAPTTPPAGTFTQVSAGKEHTCGLRTNGSIVCWGSNTNGQSTPPPGPFTQVSAGDAHTCALQANGDRICWGDNSQGQAPGITIAPITLPMGAVGETYNQTISAAGGDPPFAYSLVSGSLPAGLSLNPETGEISGIPAVGGNFDLIAQAADSSGWPLVARQAYILEIQKARATINIEIHDPDDHSPGVITYGTPVHFQAGVASDVGAPSGKVTFYSHLTNDCLDRGISLGSADIENGVAHSTFERIFSVGTKYLRAVFEGDDVYANAGSSCLSLTITARPVTVAAEPRTKLHGQADPPFTYQITSGALVAGDSFGGVPARQPGEAPGVYKIQQGTLSAGSNYTLTFVEADLTILQPTYLPSIICQ